MKYVLDASVALKWVLAEPDSHVALRLRSEYEQRMHELIAPDIFSAECGHGLGRAERKRALTIGESTIHLADIMTTLPELHSSLSLLIRASQLASQMRLSFYDCLYVSLAEQEHCDLLTADAKLVSALRGYPVIHLSSLPS